MDLSDSQNEEQDCSHGSEAETDGPNNGQSKPRPSPLVITPTTLSPKHIYHSPYPSKALARVSAVQTVDFPSGSANCNPAKHVETKTMMGT